jgi:transcriptional regulator with XRE-family HTH domain
MSRPLPRSRIWVDPQDFKDLRRQSGLTRKQTACALDVTGRTIQNWETGGARIPWMAYRMLRILRGYALPGKDWEGWMIDGETLYAPNGRRFTGSELQHIEQVFGMARLGRQMYAEKCRAEKAAKEAANKVLLFPALQISAQVQEAPQGHLKLIGGTQR